MHISFLLAQFKSICKNHLCQHSVVLLHVLSWGEWNILLCAIHVVAGPSGAVLWRHFRVNDHTDHTELFFLNNLKNAFTLNLVWKVRIKMSVLKSLQLLLQPFTVCQSFELHKTDLIRLHYRLNKWNNLYVAGLTSGHRKWEIVLFSVCEERVHDSWRWMRNECLCLMAITKPSTVTPAKQIFRTWILRHTFHLSSSYTYGWHKFPFSSIKTARIQNASLSIMSYWFSESRTKNIWWRTLEGEERGREEQQKWHSVQGKWCTSYLAGKQLIL